MQFRALCWLGLASFLSGCSLVVDADQFRDIGGGSADAGPTDFGLADARDAGTVDAEPTDEGPQDRDISDLGESDGALDASPQDGDSPDQGDFDIGAPDIGPTDTEPNDMAGPDVGMLDSGQSDMDLDAGQLDMNPADTGGPDVGVDAGQPDTGFDAGTPPNLVTIEAPPGGIPEGVGSGGARGIPIILSGSNFLSGDTVTSDAPELEVRSVNVIDSNYIVAEVAAPIAAPSSGTMTANLTVRRLSAASASQSVTLAFYPEITDANAATAGDGVYAALNISTSITRTQTASWTIWGFATISSAGAITLAGGGGGGAASTTGGGAAGGAAGARGSGGGGGGGSIAGTPGGAGAAGGLPIGNAYVIPIGAHLGSGGGGGSGSNSGGDGGAALHITAMGPASIGGSFDASGTSGDNATPDAVTGCVTGASSAGGGGSGGSVVIRSPEIDGNLSVNVSGGPGGALACSDTDHAGGNGAPGRIRIDGEVTGIAGYTPTSAVTARGPMWAANLPITVQANASLTAHGGGLPVGSQWVIREQGNPGVEVRPAAAATVTYNVVESPVQPVLRLICIGVDTTRAPIDTSHAGSDREHCLWFAVVP